MNETRSSPFQPTLLGAAWRYRLILVLAAILFGVAGWFYGSRGQVYTATASVTVQEPQSSAIFDANATLDPKRYVANQSAILTSSRVAEQAALILAAEEPPIILDPLSIEYGVDVDYSTAEDVIAVSYTDVSSARAIATVNSVAEAYRDVSKVAAEDALAAALSELDDSIAELETAVNAATLELAGNTELSTTAITVEGEIEAAERALLALESPQISQGDDGIITFRSEFNELKALLTRLRAAQAAIDIPVPDEALLREQQDLQTRLSALQLRRDGLIVDTGIAGSGVTYVGAARTAVASSVMVFALAGAVFGVLVGGALAFYLALGRRHFGGRSEPQMVLGTSLIADIPDFETERLSTPVPVLDAPTSAAAESFRFVATALAGQQSATTDGTRTGRAAAIGIVAASHREGTTTIASNTALAAAQAGDRVALIDAHFGSQVLAGLLAIDDHPGFGLTGAADDGSDVMTVGQPIPIVGKGSLILFDGGSAGQRPADFFASRKAAAIMEELRSQFDLVLVDLPPVLRVAHSGSAIRLLDFTLAVVEHGGSAPGAAEFREQLISLGTPMAGYVYNRAPLRREMVRSEKAALDQDPA